MVGATTSADERSDDRASEKLSIWIDIENPPQVRYLVPLVRTFAQRDADVYVTARDYGMTFDLLREQGVAFVPVGRHFGAAKRRKVVGTLRRVQELRRLLSGRRQPNLVISASRSASLAARSLGIPSFVHCDYEFADFSAYRVAGSFVVHPDVISADAFRSRGVSAARLMPYQGIKEDITFTGIDLQATEPYLLPAPARPGARKVLFRPPAEESHYHRRESSTLGGSALRLLADDADVQVVLSPRYEWQADIVRDLDWKTPPVVLMEPAPVVSLLKAIDVVASGGGTMTREAAYLGIPAISLFRGREGEVDRYLESIGRLTIVRSEGELARLDFRRLAHTGPLYTNRTAAEDVASAIVSAARRSGRQASPRRREPRVARRTGQR